jgi:rRNA-processing protein FCF1
MRNFINIVIVDANFILLPFQFKIDYLEEISRLLEGKIKFVIFKQVLNELEAKKKREPRAVKFEKLLNSGILYLEKNRENYPVEFIEEIKNRNETTDSFLIRKSIELKDEGNKIYLATNDKDLKRIAKKRKINRIFLRQKNYLSIEYS